MDPQSASSLAAAIAIGLGALGAGTESRSQRRDFCTLDLELGLHRGHWHLCPGRSPHRQVRLAAAFLIFGSMTRTVKESILTDGPAKDLSKDTS